jgi:hypothetical protein
MIKFKLGNINEGKQACIEQMEFELTVWHHTWPIPPALTAPFHEK